MIGTTVAHYSILDKLGEGGMGVVYRARDTHLDRIVAVKVIRPDAVADPERKRRFVQEAKTASALNHPNILHIYDIGQAAGVDFIAMEYVEGKPLDQLIGRKRLPLAEALNYAVQISGALAKAHGAGIVHRDLKPANVMVTRDGLVKLLDFGLAKLTEPMECDEYAATQTQRPGTEQGMILGTVGYMSPEQAQGQKVSAGSDIFSFGAVLYEMITGVRAFRGESKLAVLTAILHSEPEPVREHVEDVPAELERIIARCLRKDPARRFQGMNDLRVALEEVKEESESGSGPVPLPPPSRRPRRWNLAWVAASAALLLALLSLLTWWIWVRSRTVPETVFSAAPITSYPGRELHPTFSPDGTQIAFSWNGDQPDNFDIWIKAIGPGTPFRLTTAAAKEFSPAWSPDGRFIAFLRQLSVEKVAVILVPPLGGPERRLAEINAPPLPEVIRGPFLAWSPDSKILALSNRVTLRDPASLFLLALDTLEQSRLTTPPNIGLGDFAPAFASDGSSIAFARFFGPTISEIHLLSLSQDHKPAGEPRRLTFENAFSLSPVWAPGGKEIVFSSGSRSNRGLWKIPLLAGAGARSQRIVGAGEEAFVLAVSSPIHGAAKLAYCRESSDINIWGIDRPAGGPAAAPKPVVDSTWVDFHPRLSPDGERMAFISTRTGAGEIWLSSRDGANPVQLTSLNANQSIFPRWSPDGARIAFTSFINGPSDNFVIGVEGGPPKPLISHPATDVAPSWSRDGRWIYFFSTRGGSVQVWKAPAGGGAAIQVTSQGGYVAVESPDGRFLYYSKSDQAPTSLWRVPVGGGEEMQIIESLHDMMSFDVADDGIYFIPGSKPGNPALIEYLSFATGKVASLATLHKAPNLGFTVSRDGRHIRYSQVDREDSDLMLVENFR